MSDANGPEKINRRSAIVRTGAGALGFGLVGAVGVETVATRNANQPHANQPHANQPHASFRQPMEGRRMAMSLKYGMIGPGATVMEKFEIAKAAGFDGVELDSPGPVAIDDAKRAMDATGLVVPGVVDSAHWSKPFSSADPNVRGEGRRALETAISDCAALGGSTVLVVPAVVNGSVSYADAYERSINEISMLVPMAEELGVAIGFENVWNSFLLSPLEAARYVDAFDSAHVGWYFDVGNIVAFGWPTHWIEALGQRVLKLDVKEYSRQKRDREGMWAGFGVEIGEGDCQWPEVNKALHAIGYRGWASAEVGGGDAARLTNIRSRMRSVLGE